MTTAAAAAVLAAASISLETFADLLDASSVQETLDIGNALIYKVTHPERGNMVLVNTTGGCARVLC
jgi:hypothetical protein